METEVINWLCRENEMLVHKFPTASPNERISSRAATRLVRVEQAARKRLEGG